MNPQPAAQRRSSGGLLTVLLSVLATLAALVSVGLSPFFVMAADSCGVNNCQEWRITAAYLVAWGGVALAVIVAVVGMVRAARRGAATWVWPALALGLVMATFAGGFALAASAVR